MIKKIVEKVQGERTRDGAGVSLVRVLGKPTIESFDPFLMLDSFDSTNPDDYIKGFPEHPHRGIETITYLAKGRIDHKDSLGNAGTINSGDAQWMTAGSGIMHEEMPKPAERMLGLQFWLNLPMEDKMTVPKYFDIMKDKIPLVEEEGVKVHVIAGKFKDIQGAKSHHLPATFLDIELEEGAELVFDSSDEVTSFAFTLDGDAIIAGEHVEAKTAARLKSGNKVSIKGAKGGSRLVFAEAPPLREPVAWAGPIVMNTQAEIQEAYKDLRERTFIKDKPE
ncbi:MAG: pirin family protein [Tissierellia bacterium]|nr:pirin family protein [Tissierellia bacterium]